MHWFQNPGEQEGKGFFFTCDTLQTVYICKYTIH